MAVRKVMRWWFALLALPLLYLALVVVVRLLPPTPEQQSALALLNAPTPPVAGRDGSDAAWLLEYAVPAGSRTEVARQYRDYLTKKNARPPIPDSAAGKNPLDAWKKFPALPAGGEGLCTDNQPGCLDYVRANRQQVKDVLEQHRARLDSALEFAYHDGMRYGLVPTVSQEVPQFGPQRRLVNTWFAYEFISSRPQEAIQGLCLDIAGWRRLGGNSDHLLGSMIGVSNVRQGLSLLSDMLAEFPIASELPFSCEVALGASADYELDLCPAIRNEFQLHKGLEAEIDAGEAAAGKLLRTSWFADMDYVLAQAAVSRAPWCQPAAVQTARADRSLATILPRQPPRCPDLRRIADPFGCVLAEVSWSDYSRYGDRRTDQAAMLALMRTVVWLRTAAETQDNVVAALEQRPAILRLRRNPTFEMERGKVSIPLLDSSRGERFELSVRLVTPKPRSRPVFRARGSAFAAP